MAKGVQLQPGRVFDGYTLVRPLGQGGFGVVWLAVSSGTGAYHALKWISGSGLKHEWSAVRLFREVSQRLRSPHLIAIEHVNQTKSALYYTMPLADGGPGTDPVDPRWQPFTLTDYIEQKKADGTWFSSSEILALFLPVAHVVTSLNQEGLVHRDIKPANILFFGGQPCLSDVGLLGNDRMTLSIKGTPGHVPPSWYEGEPDMWGLATTLYVLLTGNLPDTMGRANFRWPYGDKNRLSLAEQEEWLRLHNVIFRATAEGANERYIGLEALVKTVASTTTSSPPPLPPPLPSDLPSASISEPQTPRKNPILRPILLGIFLGILLMAYVAINFPSTNDTPSMPSQAETPPTLVPSPPPPSSAELQTASAPTSPPPQIEPSPSPSPSTPIKIYLNPPTYLNSP